MKELLDQANLQNICLFDRGQSVDKEKIEETVASLGFDPSAAKRLAKLMEKNEINYIFTTKILTAIDGKVDKKLYGKLLQPGNWYRTRLQVTSQAVKTLPAVLNAGGKPGYEGHRDSYTGYNAGKRVLWLGGKYEDNGATFLGYSYDADLSKDMENASIAGCPYGFSLMNLRPKATKAVERAFVDNTQKMPYVTLDMPLTFDSIDLIDSGKQADKGAIQKNGTQLNESEEENELELTKEEITEIVNLAMKTSNDTILALGKKLDDYIKTGEENPEQDWEKEKKTVLSAYKTVKIESANLGEGVKAEDMLALVPGDTKELIDEQVLALQKMRESHRKTDFGDKKKSDEGKENAKSF
ncbi:hypothetical protein KAR91_70075 [Candidatus Pacearchaeota archaeon]|nr:hypothetical protein [Candidatus Pacearchaeota archaeon]